MVDNICWVYLNLESISISTYVLCGQFIRYMAEIASLRWLLPVKHVQIKIHWMANVMSKAAVLAPVVTGVYHKKIDYATRQ